MSYNTDDAATRLSEVRKAIAKVLASQSYSIGQRQQRLAELKELRQMEKDLQAEVAREAGTNFGISLGQVDLPGKD